MSEIGVEHTALLVRADPTYRVVVVVPPATSAGIAPNASLRGIDGQQHTQLLARIGRGREAEELSGPLDRSRAETLHQRTRRVLHFQRDLLVRYRVRPGVRAEHLREFRPIERRASGAVMTA